MNKDNLSEEDRSRTGVSGLYTYRYNTRNLSETHRQLLEDCLRTYDDLAFVAAG